jgi:branched-subunit amino acid aminotransferase/4-amino-4-deoxychorismate lyase
MRFMPESELKVASLNGSLRLRNEADVLDALNSPNFRKGCFETMLAADRMLPLIDLHLSRLQKSADYLKFEIPANCTKAKILRTIETLYDIYTGEESRFRARLTIFPQADGSSGWLLYMDPIILPSKPYKLKLSPHLREFEPIEALKCKRSARDHYLAAYYDATDDGFDDALMLTIDGYVSETTIANIFWINGNEVFTPSTKCYPLSGLGQEVLRSAIENTEITIQEGEYSISDVINADLVFIVNAVRGPVPIQKIDDTEKSIKHPIFQIIFDHYWSSVMKLI